MLNEMQGWTHPLVIKLRIVPEVHGRECDTWIAGGTAQVRPCTDICEDVLIFGTMLIKHPLEYIRLSSGAQSDGKAWQGSLG